MDNTQTPPNQPISSTPINQPPRKPFIPIIIGGILLLALTSIVAYYLGTRNKISPQISSSQPSPTLAVAENNSWKTYYGKTYSFQYPLEWPLVEVTPAPQCTSCIDELVFTPSFDPNSGDNNIAVILVGRGTKLNQREYLNMYRTNKMYTDVIDTTIGGVEAVSYKLNGGIPPLPIIALTTIKDGIRYEIRLEDSSEANRNREFNIKALNKLISTFTFLDQIQINNSSNRKYVNELAGFSMIFPEGWRMPASVYKATVTLPPDGPGPGTGFQISKTAVDNTTPPLLTVHTLERISEANIVEQAKKLCSWLINDKPTFNAKEIIVGGHKAAYIENIEQYPYQGPNVYGSCVLISGERGINIVWHNDTQSRGDIDLLLENFTFLN